MMIRDVAAALLLLTAASPALAQGFSPPPGSAQPAPMPATPSGGMPAQGFPGFAPPAGAGADPSQPARQNYADELTDFGVPPQPTLQSNVGSPTPLTLPGGHVITTAEVKQALGTNIVFIDVWQQPTHPSLPGAVPMPGAGNPGSFNDETQQRLWTALAQATNKQPDRPIVFFCTGSRCWESYNAALRAVNMGFKMVLWYRGGLAAWQAAGGPMATPGQAAPDAGAGHIGFGQ
jgi:PQQ-dependent catabolism-associated CXXCW motif protein